MKKLGILIVGAFFLTACDATPGGNKVILPVEHEEAVEHVDHHEGHTEQNHTGDHHASEQKDSANRTVPAVAPKDSANKVDESPENAAH